MQVFLTNKKPHHLKEVQFFFLMKGSQISSRSKTISSTTSIGNSKNNGNRLVWLTRSSTHRHQYRYFLYRLIASIELLSSAVYTSKGNLGCKQRTVQENQNTLGINRHCRQQQEQQQQQQQQKMLINFVANNKCFETTPLQPYKTIILYIDIICIRR